MPILLSSPSGFDTLSGSVLLLAADQYVLFSSFLVSLSLHPWGDVQKKCQSSLKAAVASHHPPAAASPASALM